jgi:AbiU2
MTGEEIEKRNIAAMGHDLGKQYSALCHELTALYLYWKEFIELFGTNDKRIERLNKSAPGFFQMLLEQQFETNILHLARITDVSKTGTKDNLTVCNLPDLVTDEALKAALIPLVKEARSKTKFCRDWAAEKSVVEGSGGAGGIRTLKRPAYGSDCTPARRPSNRGRNVTGIAVRSMMQRSWRSQSSSALAFTSIKPLRT